jgi:hypothetical protein
VFSNEVIKSIKPYIHETKYYLFLNNVAQNSPIMPYGLDTELIKLLKNFTLIPESNLLIERDFELNSLENNVFKPEESAIEDIHKYLERCKLLTNQYHLRGEAKKFVMEGVLPYIYKYASVLLNLTNFELKTRGVNPYSDIDENNQKSLKLNPNDLKQNLNIARILYKHYQEYHPYLVDLTSRSETHTLFEELEKNGLNLMDETEGKLENKISSETKIDTKIPQKKKK